MSVGVSWFAIAVLFIVALPFLIPIVAIMMAPIIILAEGLTDRKHGKSESKDRKVTEQEQRRVQRLHADLLRMEKRIEALETILTDEIRRHDEG